ncbi:MAG: ATP-binding cassette domain-containing protein [Anaerolineaceae bacterium]|nr:ATP-binding cassette domain-containing protein [Anaerolineaceae bacterium]
MSQTSAYCIETRQLTRTFKNIAAVQDLNLQMPYQSVYGFLGPNGAGKTTTIRMLLGLIKPDQGDVRIFGEPMNRKNISIFRKIGALVESPSLYPNLTGEENLEVTRRMLDLPKANIAHVLRLVKLQDASQRVVKGYSTGMKQRLGLALAMLSDPELLILDEPTNGLDPAGIHEIRDLILELPKTAGVNVFLSSHLLSEVELMATHIGIIHQGHFRFQGTLSELNAHYAPQLILQVAARDEVFQILNSNGYEVQKNNGSIQVSIQSPEQAESINRLIIDHGYQIQQSFIKQPTLEDIFMTLTK